MDKTKTLKLLFFLFPESQCPILQKNKWLGEENLHEIVHNNEDSEFNDDNIQSYDSDKSIENISRPVYFES